MVFLVDYLPTFGVGLLELFQLLIQNGKYTQHEGVTRPIPMKLRRTRLVWPYGPPGNLKSLRNSFVVY